MATGAAGHRGGPAIESVEGAQAAVSDDEKAAVEAQEPDEAPKSGEGRFVQYLGPRNVVANAEALRGRDPKLGEGTKAVFGPAEWAKAGVSGSQTLEWSVFNNYRIPVTQFTSEQLDLVLNCGKRFQLVDSAGNKIKH